MTSAELVGALARVHQIGDQSVRFGPDAVYYAATLAQKDILTTLKLLQREVQLGLAANQERYTFPVTAIANVTSSGISGPFYTSDGQIFYTIEGMPFYIGTAPVSGVVIEATGHPFNTGDEVFINGVLGATEANGHWTLIRLDEDHFLLNDLLVASAYSSGGSIYHALNSGFEILRDGVRITTGTDGEEVMAPTLNKKTLSEIELYRTEFDASETGNIINFYEMYTDPLTIGFQAVPAGAGIAKIVLYRKPLPFEDVSVTANPIVPNLYDMLLILGARAYMYLLSDSNLAQLASEKSMAIFRQEMARVQGVHLNAKRVAAVGDGSMKW